MSDELYPCACCGEGIVRIIGVIASRLCLRCLATAQTHEKQASKLLASRLGDSLGRDPHDRGWPCGCAPCRLYRALTGTPSNDDLRLIKSMVE